MDIKVCKVKKVQVPIIKNNSGNHLLRSNLFTLKEEIKKDKDALEMWLPIMETKMDANMMAYMVTTVSDQMMYI